LLKNRFKIDCSEAIKYIFLTEIFAIEQFDATGRRTNGERRAAHRDKLRGDRGVETM